MHGITTALWIGYGPLYLVMMGDREYHAGYWAGDRRRAIRQAIRAWRQQDAADALRRERERVARDELQSSGLVLTLDHVRAAGACDAGIQGYMHRHGIPAGTTTMPAHQLPELDNPYVQRAIALARENA